MKQANDEGVDLIPTVGGRFQKHPRGLVGNLWRIKTPDTVHIGHCFMEGRLQAGDLVLCTQHSGDGFQDYVFVKEYANGLKLLPAYEFGSYGIGDAEKTELNAQEFFELTTGSNWLKLPLQETLV